MPDLFNLNIYTPQGVLYSSSAKRITALNSLGQFGVLPGHTIFASDIVNGEMQVLNDSGQEIDAMQIEDLNEYYLEKRKELMDSFYFKINKMTGKMRFLVNCFNFLYFPLYPEN